MENQRIVYLLSGYLNDELTPLESDELRELLLSDGTAPAIEVAVEQLVEMDRPMAAYDRQKWELVLGRVLSHASGLTDSPRPVKSAHRVHFLKNTWFRYAATVLIMIGLGTWLLTKPRSSENNSETATSNVSIKPGGNKATLTLSDGRQVELNDSANQLISDQDIIITKNQGILTYNNAPTSETAVISYNTMTTPRGGQYQLLLPDGSKVWLNSASSLRYPTRFAEAQRVVELQGEGYFEVKGNKSAPFIVKTNKKEVTVLGTAFNVNAYADEPALATTLIEGAVKVSGVILKPGEQAQFTYATNASLIKKPDLEEVLAWKQGKFQFTNEPITTIMRQLSRWYDVDIMYKGNTPEAVFSGTLLRSQNPFSLINAMEKTGEIHFEVRGKTIVVLNGPKP